jgi:hypothetical protein
MDHLALATRPYVFEEHVRYVEADEDDGEDVEDDNTEENSVDYAGYVSSGITLLSRTVQETESADDWRPKKLTCVMPIDSVPP